MADERDDRGSEERLRDYFKYISTVDAAGVVGALAVVRELEIGIRNVAMPLVFFGISAILCILGMFFLAQSALLRPEGWAEGGLIRILFVLTLMLTTVGIAALIFNSLSA